MGTRLKQLVWMLAPLIGCAGSTPAAQTGTQAQPVKVVVNTEPPEPAQAERAQAPPLPVGPTRVEQLEQLARKTVNATHPCCERA